MTVKNNTVIAPIAAKVFCRIWKMSANPRMISESMIMGEANEKISNPYLAIIFENASASIDFDIPEKINTNPVIRLQISFFLSDIV